MAQNFAEKPVSFNSTRADFGFLDQAEFQRTHARGDRIRFYVEGISCGNCVRTIESLALKTPGLKEIRVDLSTHIAEAEIDRRHLTFSRLARAIEGAGFQPIPILFDNPAEALQLKEDRRELVRLAIAGACAGNIMTFSFANYFGAAAQFSELFSWLSFALYLPVVGYVARPFYKGAWQSLKRKRLSIDLPMAVASFAGFVFSTVQLLRGMDDFYFDSLSGFLFLILLSRWLQRRLQRIFLRPQELKESLQLGRARKMDGENWKWTPTEKLRPGDKILINASETLPADARLESPGAHFSLAWLSGESAPKTFFRGADIPAGARLNGGSASAIVTRTLEDSDFGKLLAQVEGAPLGRAATANAADLRAQWLLAVVFVMALAFLTFYWSVSPEEAVRRSLALIILACPCAMAFGTPLALAAALRRARRSGLVVRTAEVFEKAARVRTIFFDKTGTLTDGDISLVTPAEHIPEKYRQVILALENKSTHPIAFSFRRALRAEIPVVAEWREVPGLGVEGYVFGRFYELKSGPRFNDELSCTLFETGAPILRFEFKSVLKPRTQEVLDALRGDGIRTVLLSGDSSRVTNVIGEQLGFSASDIFAECSPAGKAEELGKNQNAMMVGDGVNDSLAMLVSDVAVAVSGGMESALKSADVYLVDASLNGVRELITISRRAVKLINRNIAISLAYNMIAGVLALCGFINPLIAAILMPVSSGFILLSTWIEERRW